MKVEIDGVLYVPVGRAAVEVDEVLRALALQWHTPEGLAENGYQGMRVIVSYNEDYGGETFDEFAARLVSGEAR
jgi:hypothetical protein